MDQSGFTLKLLCGLCLLAICKMISDIYFPFIQLSIRFLGLFFRTRSMTTISMVTVSIFT